jgi:uncharacterized membrane protein affecting hemolysin expression
MNTNSLLNELVSTEAVFDHHVYKSQEDLIGSQSYELGVRHTTPKSNMTSTKLIDGFKYVTMQSLTDKNSYKSGKLFWEAI